MTAHDFSNWIHDHGEALQTGAFFGLFVGLALLERWLPGRSIDRGRPRRWRTNLCLTALNVLVLMVLPVSLIAAAAWASERGIGLLELVTLPFAALVIVNLLLRALIAYVTHLLMHQMPVLWRIHRVHHLDTELDVSTTVRFHPAEIAAGAIVGIPMVLLLGLSPWVLVLYEILDVAVTLFSHANIRIRPAIDRLLRYVVVTPNLHRIHHSTWQPETDSNFGAVFPVWDLVFGTFRRAPRQPPETMPIGLEEVRGPRADDLMWLLASPARPTIAAEDVASAPGTTPPSRLEVQQ